MDNQHRLIKGFRDLTQAEIDLMNEVKAHGAALEATISKIETTLGAEDSEARRWLAIGKTDLQKGLMGVTRAVAKPTFF